MYIIDLYANLSLSELDQKEADEYVLKICAIGSGNVGKTSLLRRFAEGKFTMNYLFVNSDIFKILTKVVH